MPLQFIFFKIKISNLSICLQKYASKYQNIKSLLAPKKFPLKIEFFKIFYK
jgi:hypothetical protein